MDKILRVNMADLTIKFVDVPSRDEIENQGRRVCLEQNHPRLCHTYSSQTPGHTYNLVSQFSD